MHEDPGAYWRQSVTTSVPTLGARLHRLQPVRVAPRSMKFCAPRVPVSVSSSRSR